MTQREVTLFGVTLGPKQNVYLQLMMPPTVSNVICYHCSYFVYAKRINYRKKVLQSKNLLFYLSFVLSGLFSISASYIIRNAKVHRLRLRAAILNSVCLVFVLTPDPDASPSNVKLARRKTSGIYFALGSFVFGWLRACQLQALFFMWGRKLYPTQKLFSVKYGL